MDDKFNPQERFKEEISRKKKVLLNHNKVLLTAGHKDKYQNNCNFLAGISWVMGRLKRHKIIQDK